MGRRKRICSPRSSGATKLYHLAMLQDYVGNQESRAKLYLSAKVSFIKMLYWDLQITIISDNIPMAVPTLEWQDRISSQLGSLSQVSMLSSNHKSQFASTFDSDVRMPQRRRTDDLPMPDRARFHPNWNEMYTMGPPSGTKWTFYRRQSMLIYTFPDSDDSTCSDAADAVGQLSLDENSEVHNWYCKQPIGHIFNGRIDSISWSFERPPSFR